MRIEDHGEEGRSNCMPSGLFRSCLSARNSCSFRECPGIGGGRGGEGEEDGRRKTKGEQKIHQEEKLLTLSVYLTEPSPHPCLSPLLQARRTGPGRPQSQLALSVRSHRTLNAGT